MKLCITGANSSVGRTLLSQLAGRDEFDVHALARSPRADTFPSTATNIVPVPAKYEDHTGLVAAFAGAQAVVHLAGILFENKDATYQSANVDSTLAVVRAAQGARVPRLVFVSVLGADPASSNPYYRSKGQAENLVIQAQLEATVLRTPLLLGPLSAGGQALLREACGKRAKLLGGGRHRVRPLDVDDLCAALVACCTVSVPGARVLELCGPESLLYRDLVIRMAHTLGSTPPHIGGVPPWLAKIFAAFSHGLNGGGLSPAIVDVITSSETVENNAATILGMELTPLDKTLAKLADKEPLRG